MLIIRRQIKKLFAINNMEIQIIIDDKTYYGEYDMKNIHIGDYVQIFKMSHYCCTNKINNKIYLSEI